MKLHWYSVSGKIVFLTEGTDEMFLPGKMRIHTRSIGKVWANGRAWSVSERSLLTLIKVAQRAGFEVCQECSPDVPCEHFARVISYWVNDTTARVQHAARKAEREKARNPFQWKAPRAEKKEAVSVDPREKAAKVLGLSWPCSKDEVSRAFRAKIVKAHPDLGGSDEEAKELIEARELLLK